MPSFGRIFCDVVDTFGDVPFRAAGKFRSVPREMISQKGNWF
jgi:hypothetical protein